MMRPMIAGVLASFAFLTGCGDGSGAASPAPTPTATPTPTPTPDGVRHILFVGDSLTHGRYEPVRSYNAGGAEVDAGGSALVTDENYRQTGNRAELESGPWGGIPGIFAEFAVEAGLKYDVHIEAISETSLAKNYAAASSVIDQGKWNAVVLQEISTRPLPASLSGDSSSDPAQFCSSVQTIEAGIHVMAPQAGVFLYETWPNAATAKQLSGSTTASDFPTRYASSLESLRAAYQTAYYAAAQKDGKIAGVAPVGDAWAAAWAAGIANPNPYGAKSDLPLLWYGIQATNDPAITSPDYLHPGALGAYLSGLVLFEQITGVDVRTLGGSEQAAAQLGIGTAAAVRLQQIAYATVTNGKAVAADPRTGGC